MLGGVVILLAVLWKTRRAAVAADSVALEACRLYWTFVVAVWPLLYVLVYLS